MTKPKNILLALLLLVLLLVTTGCGLQKGYVYHKGYEPAYTSIETGQNCYGTGSTRRCTTYEYPVYHPAQYWLDLSSCPVNHDGCDTGSVDVDQTAWDKAYIGEYVNFGGS